MGRERMFEKVVTPSDVGKLNRLVIPKQHAEKYFPLDSSATENGLLLSFEDRTGKPWRFRYSYWNSSQSYVMTKGWSRFVKEKKLDAGDIVSFERGVGEQGRDRLYIDWRHRPSDVPNPMLPAALKLPNQPPFPRSAPWASRVYSLPSSVSVSVSIPRHQEHPQELNYTLYPPFPPPHHHHLHHHHRIGTHEYSTANSSSGSVYYLTPSAPYDQHGAVSQEGDLPVAIDSVPVVHHRKTAPKRLRLFGVNMECSIPEEPELPMASFSPYTPSLSTTAPKLKPPNAATLPTNFSDFSKKEKSSLTFAADS